MTTTTGKRILLGKKTENRRVWNIRGQPIKAIVGRTGTVIHAIGFELSSIHGGTGETEFRVEPASLPAVFGVCLVCVWCAFGVCLVCVWCVFGVCLVCVWCVCVCVCVMCGCWLVLNRVTTKFVHSMQM